MSDELTALALSLGQGLSQQGVQVATAESCTGGGIAEVITRIPGSSAWFEAGCVTYSNAQKTRQLGVSVGLLAEFGAVSAEVAAAMAQGVQQLAGGVRFAVATTGIAGPGGAEPGKPVGTVWLAWQAGTLTYVRCCRFKGERQSVRQQAVQLALEGLLQLCDGLPPTDSQPFSAAI